MKISSNRSFFFSGESIRISDFKMCLRLIRCVGHLISKLYLHKYDVLDKLNCVDSIKEFGVIKGVEIFAKNTKMYRRLCKYTNEYCAEYLEELSIFQNDCLDYFDKPFPNLRRFNIRHHKSTKMVCVSKLISHMKLLDHLYEGVSYNGYTKHFPNLERLSITHRLKSDLFFSPACYNILIELLRLDPQLKEIRLITCDGRMHLNTHVIHSTADGLQNDEPLVLFLEFTYSHIILTHLVTVRFIDFEKVNIWPTHPIKFLATQEEDFYIRFPEKECSGRFYDLLFHFINEPSTIKSLAVWCGAEQ